MCFVAMQWRLLLIIIRLVVINSLIVSYEELFKEDIDFIGSVIVRFRLEWEGYMRSKQEELGMWVQTQILPYKRGN
jgi:hypothetical protein